MAFRLFSLPRDWSLNWWKSRRCLVAFSVSLYWWCRSWTVEADSRYWCIWSFHFRDRYHFMASFTMWRRITYNWVQNGRVWQLHRRKYGDGGRELVCNGICVSVAWQKWEANDGKRESNLLILLSSLWSLTIFLIFYKGHWKKCRRSYFWIPPTAQHNYCRRDNNKLILRVYPGGQAKHLSLIDNPFILWLKDRLLETRLIFQEHPKHGLTGLQSITGHDKQWHLF